MSYTAGTLLSYNAGNHLCLLCSLLLLSPFIVMFISLDLIMLPQWVTDKWHQEVLMLKRAFSKIK